jgi:TOMM system kinase/cyclase fusion protein
MSAKELLAGRYEILHALGAGSGGEVYKALQRSTGQTVAIKLLNLEELEGDQRARRIERFRREIAFCSQLYHPDIVRLLDSGELDGDAHYAVFEFIPGMTLARLVSDAGMLTVQRARNVMSQLLPPLAYAHAKGIFHRDLKPTNIMVTTVGARDRLKILDFGISIAVGQEQEALARLTLSHEWVGTPTYAAPEQLRGEPPGAKSDLYAWGLIFVECVTGKSVVRGRSVPEIVEQQLRPDPHVLPAALRQHRLGGLLQRILEKNPARRSGDADALLANLETISTSDLEDAQGYLRDLPQEATRMRAPVLHSDTVIAEQGPRHVEQRYATVVTCHVAFDGAGPLSSVELLDTLIEETSVLAREILTQFGADTCHSFGGYCLAYFGLVRARDTDARLALRASLDLIARLERTPHLRSAQGLSLRVQIGIHNGPVTVQQREGSRRPVDGVTAAVAMSLACLDAASDPNESSPRIVVSDKFRALIARHATFQRLPGENGPRRPWQGVAAEVYRLAGEPAAVIRELADRSVFVGRARELEALHAAWVRSRSPAPVATLVTGEAGIGKSRLARELRARLQGEGVQWLEARCLPEWQNAFLRPLSTLAVEHFKLSLAEPEEAARSLEGQLAGQQANLTEAVPLFCAWLSLPLPDGYAPLAWSPQKRRQVLLEILADVLIVCMERRAALFVDDLHWADPTTLEWLDVLSRRAAGRAVFILMTSRPGVPLSWPTPPSEIPLAGLDANAVGRLVSSLVPGFVPDELTMARVAERSDGVPLYVEELAMALSAPATAPGESAVRTRGTPLTNAVPPSLRDLLTSRLDDIGEAKRSAQLAGALGRDFSFEVLAACAETDEPSLLGDLEQLVSAGLLVKQAADRTDYVFRHALIRDAAYESMPSRLRERTHSRIAEALEQRFKVIAEAQPDILAHHWEHAGHAARALSYWKIAARNSARASAHLEALAQLDRGIALLSQLPDTAERSVHEAELMLARAATNVAKRGYTDPDAARCFERVTELVAPEGKTLELAFAARWGLWYFHNTQANLRQSWAIAQELSALARSSGESSLTVSAWEAMCETSFCIGRLEESVEASRRCEAEYDFARHRHLCTVRGDDPHLASLSFEALAEIVRGRHESAAARCAQGIAHAQRLEYPSMVAAMHAQTAWVYLVWGSSGARTPDLTHARAHAATALKLAVDLGFRFWEIYGRMIDAAARIVAGDAAAAAELREGSEIWRRAGAALGRCWHLTYIAEALRRQGDYAAALASLDEALAFCKDHDSRYFEPEVRRQRAEWFFDSANPRRDVDAGLEECESARSAAAGQGADWWLLATAVTEWRGHDGPAGRERGELQRVLKRFPASSCEPPLVREARALVRSEGVPDAMRA